MSSREWPSKWQHKGGNGPRGSGLEKAIAWGWGQGQDPCGKAGLTQGGTSAGGTGRKKDIIIGEKGNPG